MSGRAMVSRISLQELPRVGKRGALEQQATWLLLRGCI